jgi:hypothetical protein
MTDRHPPPTIKSEAVFRVTVERRDGKTESFDATGDAQVGPGFLLIPLGNRAVGFSLAGIVRWESVASRLSVGRLS